MVKKLAEDPAKAELGIASLLHTDTHTLVPAHPKPSNLAPGADGGRDAWPRPSDLEADDPS